MSTLPGRGGSVALLPFNLSVLLFLPGILLFGLRVGNAGPVPLVFVPCDMNPASPLKVLDLFTPRDGGGGLLF